jgi:hypothetical protein
VALISRISARFRRTAARPQMLIFEFSAKLPRHRLGAQQGAKNEEARNSFPVFPCCSIRPAN